MWYPERPAHQRSLLKNYLYDTANRLIQVLKVVSGADVEIGAYEYGSSNQRLRAKENGVETYYAADGSGVIAEFQTLTSNSWQWKKNYVKWGGRLVATETADGLQYQHPDRLGTKLITNASGGVISEQAHLPFGTALPLTSVAGTGEGSQSSSQPNPHQRRFTSYERSTTTNLDYAVNRHYAAEQGRFTQVDPIGMAAVSLENPQTLNLYAYCANDPVNQTDPSGLLPKWLKKLLKVAMIVLAVITAVVSVLSVINTISMIVKMSQFLQFVSKFPLLANALGVGSNLGASSALKLTLTLWKGSLIKGVMALTASVVSAVSSVASIFDKSIPTLGFIGTIAGAKGGFWGIYKVITGTASQIAKWVGAKKASAVLAFSSIIDSLRGLQQAAKKHAGQFGSFAIEKFQLVKNWKFLKVEVRGGFNKPVALLLLTIDKAIGNSNHVLTNHFMWGLAGYEIGQSLVKKKADLEKAFSSMSAPSISPLGTGYPSDEGGANVSYTSNDLRFSNLQSGPFIDFAKGGIR